MPTSTGGSVFNVGPAELMIIFILALLVFGPKKLPEVSRQLGKGIREFRRVSEEVRGEVEHAMTLDDYDEPETVSAPEPSPNGNASASTNGDAPGAAKLAEEQPPPERTD
jgi:TatA/E family protein of Tat protein translocase